MAIVKRAVAQNGVSIIDTADVYCGAAADLHYGEILIARTLTVTAL